MQALRARLTPRMRRARWWPYAAAVLATVATTALLVFAASHLTAVQTFDVSLIYLVPVLLSATLGGLGPGIVAAIVALFAFDWYFLTPPYTVTVTNPQDLIAFAVFLGAATLAGQLGAVARRHARDTALLHEMSATLSASPHPVDTLDAVANRIGAVFTLPHCTLTLSGIAGDDAGRDTVITAPVRRGGDVVSLLRLDVGPRQHLRSDERQVLETLVNAAAVSIERAYLAAEEQAAAVARESDRLKSALLSAVSHELRTPLASIKATTSGLLEGDVSYDDATLRQFLGGIDDEANRLIRLVSNLLDVSRIEAGSLRPQCDWYDLAELIGTGLGTLAPTLAQHRVTRLIATDLRLVWCDYVHVLQVLTNLLENAARYAPAGTTITIEARSQDAEALLTVGDEGPGVAADERMHIFEAFVRGSAAGARSGGVGLGLAICKGLIEANGGRIWVDQSPRGGASFTVALRSLPDPASAGAIDTAPPNVGAPVEAPS